jgi:serine/threonine-protein kinase
MTTGQGDEFTSRAQGRIGTILRGKYRIERVLGVGGMAVVYKATHRNQAEFAIKMLHPELSIRDDVRVRFLREGYAANSVKHPGVVMVVDDDVAEDGAAFLVMEMLHGAAVETLWERRGQRMPVRAVLSVADQLLDVLAAAHEKGIVHRDIKPANLFAQRDGTLKVLDFGIARVKDAAATGQVTGTGMLLGTPAFMAPEQAFAKASEIDGQTDVWAVGATLFTLLTGQPVHEGQNAAQLMIQAATSRARSLASVAPEVPPVVAQVIDCALAFEKASRWPNARAMRAAVDQATLQAFGERPSKAALATLVTADELGYAATQQGQVAMPTPRPSGMPSPVSAGTPPAAAPSGWGLRAGSTTARPVFAQAEPTPPAPVRRGRAAAAVGIASAVAVVLIGGGLVVRAALGTKHDPGATAATTVGPSAAPAVVAPASPEPAAPAPFAAAASASTSGVDVGAVRPAVAISSRPVEHAATPPLPLPARPLSVASASAPKPAASCSPDFYYDANGNKHFKPECFGH